MTQEKTPAAILRDFFKSPDQSFTDFLTEIKALSKEERLELATLAADELGVAVKVEDTVKTAI